MSRRNVKKSPVGPQIKSIFYETNVQTAPFVHKHLGVEVTVRHGQSPEQAMLEAAKWVHEQLGIKSVPQVQKPPLRSLGDEK